VTFWEGPAVKPSEKEKGKRNSQSASRLQDLEKLLKRLSNLKVCPQYPHKRFSLRMNKCTKQFCCLLLLLLLPAAASSTLRA
jgi:hypothetical protein